MAHDTELRRAAEEFDALLDDENSLESEWQDLFTRYPFVLSHGLALDIAPDALISCKPGRAEADFYFYFYPADDAPVSPYGVIEIKRPRMRLLKTPRKDVICLSADATSAIAQATKYAGDLASRVQTTQTGLVVLGNRLHTFVIAGLSHEIAETVTSEILREQAKRLLPAGCQLVPFDVLATRLHSATPPRLHVLLPAVPDRRPGPPEASVVARDEPHGYPNRGGGGFRPRGFFGGPREFHRAVCTSCGHEVLVPFKPAEGRPVFCRDCYMKRKDERS
jgi:CxxC-x17-CxxC domain-containing protein